MGEADPESDKLLMQRFLAAVEAYSEDEAGKLVGKTGEWVRLWKKEGARARLQAKTRRAVLDYLDSLERPYTETESGRVALPSRESLAELREWIDSVLPTSPASDGKETTLFEMADVLRKARWVVIPPPGQAGGGGGDGGA